MASEISSAIDSPFQAGGTSDQSRHQSQHQSQLSAAGYRDPRQEPTRARKLKTITFTQVDAARALIKPQPLPKQKANQIVFEPDDTPADAEQIIGMGNKPGATVAKRKKPGPTPRSASELQLRQQAEINAMRAAISPNANQKTTEANRERDHNKAHDRGENFDVSGTDEACVTAELPDDEMDQIVRLVQEKYGPILDITQASEVSKLAKQTIRERVSQGMYASSVVRGRPLRFWSHRFVKEVMKP